MFGYSILGECVLAAHQEKLGWRTPIRRHSSRSDVSRLGCATQASRQRQKRQPSPPPKAL